MLNGNFRTRAVVGLAVASAVSLFSSGWASAQSVKIQPDEASSKDVFTYQLSLPGQGFGIPTAANVTNLDSANLDSLPSPIGALLGTAKTNVIDHQSLDPNINEPVLTGNSGNTWIQFDLPSADANAVTSATLNLFALDGEGATGAFANPTAAKSVTIDVHESSAAWDEQTLTWETEPAAGALVTTTVQDSVGDWVSFDVTALVKAWLDGSKDNNGVVLSQRDVVASDNQALAGLEKVHASLFASSGFGDPARFGDDPTLRPFLQINGVPEPASVSILAIGAGVLMLRRRG